MENKPIECYFTLHGINYKNGFVTSCPQSPQKLFKIENVIKPSEIFNSEGFRKHRLEMMSGTWSRGCHLCKDPESIGNSSMRQSYKPELSFYESESRYINEFNRKSLPGEVWPKGLKHIELRFSNSCNMACKHCSVVYSSGWVSKLKNYVPDKEDIKYDIKQLLRTEHRVNENDIDIIEISLNQVKEIVDDLCEYALGLEKVEFAGGEVLNQKQFFYFLELLANHPNAKDLLISFYTNFNADFDPEKLQNLLKPFGHVFINISVDAGKNIYPYFRTGDWEKLKENIKKFRNYSNNSTIMSVITTSVYQIMDLQNIFSSLLELDFFNINSSIVFSPIYLNPALLTFKFRNHIIDDINETFEIIENEEKRRIKNKEFYRVSWRDDKFNDIETAKKSLNEIKNYVLNTDIEKQAQTLVEFQQEKEITFKKFLIYLKKTDTIWKQNFNDYIVNYKFVNNEIRRVK